MEQLPTLKSGARWLARSDVLVGTEGDIDEGLTEQSHAASEWWGWSARATRVPNRIGVVPFLHLSVSCLTLLFAVGIAAAQTPGPKVQAVSPGARKQLPPLVLQVQPGLRVEVPNLKGHRQNELSGILERARLVQGDVAYAFSEDPDGVVTAQNPEAGQRVVRGTRVDVTFSRGPDTAIVPPLIGRPLSLARQLLARAGLEVGHIENRESEEPLETVLSQRPLPGEKAGRGSPVDLTIAVPITRVPVPPLTGLTEEAGRERLTEAGLAEGVRGERNAEEPAGTIIEQDPVAGVTVPRGTLVSRVVSAGPDLATVPDVQGKSVSEAEGRLRTAGLRLGRRQEQESDEPQGRVLQQDPAPESRVPRGSSVDVTVSSISQTVAVPDLAGLRDDEVRQRLANGGLTLGAVREEASERTAGTVLRQNPAAESRVRRGTPVTVWMATAPTKPWLTATIAGATLLLVVEGYRRLARRRKRRKDRDKATLGLEIRAVQDAGKQRFSRAPAAASRIGLVVHLDTDGRQSARFHDGDDEKARER